MEVMLVILACLAVYCIAVYAVVHVTVDKLGARSGLFGAGLVTMFMGYLWTRHLGGLLAELFWYTDAGAFAMRILYFIAWIMVPIGVTMVAVDLLKAINETRAALMKTDQDLSVVKKKKCSDEEVPSWQQFLE